MKHLIKLFFASILILLLGSCTASRNTTALKQIDYSEDILEIKKMLMQVNSSLSVQATEISNRLKNLKINNTTIQYSIPDSSGQQHIISSSNTNIQSEEKEQKETNLDVTFDLTILQQQLDSINKKIDVFYSSKEVVKQTSWWDQWKTHITYISIILLLSVILYFKWKK